MRAAFVAGCLVLLLGQGAWAFDNEARFGSYILRHGHGELLRLGACGTPYEAVVSELDRAQFELDFPGATSHELGAADLWRSLLDGLAPDEQRKHFLRWWSGMPRFRTVTHPLSMDYRDAVAYFEDELRAARAAEPGPEALRHLGHALHTLQDSYSPAHVERLPDGRIVAMSYYPSELHPYLGAPGDRVLDDDGRFTPGARQAIAATHELLLGYAESRHASDSAFKAFLGRFVAAHLALAE